RRDRACARRRHRPGRGQGPRGLPGSGRREASLRRQPGRARGAARRARDRRGPMMMPLPLSRIAQWTGGRMHAAGADADVLIDTVETDTRTLDARDGRAALFIALKGASFDGHDHVAAAAAQGARAALVSREVDAPLPQVVVADTERALGALAATLQHARKGRVVGITGSNGKTSVKQLTLAIASRAMRAHANPGNRNNEIGLPLSVIDTPDDVDVAIYEMGAGKHNDIAYLTSIARPHVALVNNIAPAHLERMQSLLGIADT